MNKMNTEVVAVGIVRHAQDGTAVEQSRLAELPDATVIFAQRTSASDAGLMQEVVAIELLETLKRGGVPLAERLSAVQLAVAVIGNSRRKLDLFAGTVDMMRAALAQSEAARLVLIAENEALLAAQVKAEGM